MGFLLRGFTIKATENYDDISIGWIGFIFFRIRKPQFVLILHH